MNNTASKSMFKKVMSQQWTAVMIGNILLFVVLAISQPSFLKPTNLMNILCQCSLYGIIAVGMTFVISTGGIDISVGMNAFFTMCVIWNLRNAGLPVPLVFTIGLLSGVLVGIINGFLICYLNFPEMIATLCTMSILRGVGYLLINLAQKFVQDEMRVIGNGKIFGIIPLPTVIMLTFTIIGILVLKYTRFGRYVLAVGGNKVSAQYTGIDVKKACFGAYIICGFCAAMAGIVYAGRVGSITGVSCSGYEFTVITAVVLGGTKMSGGKSSVLGSMLGCVFLYLVENAMTMLSISSYYQTFVRAVMMLLAIAIDTLTTRRNQHSLVNEKRERLHSM